jgi:hypothetical protein
LKGFIDFKIIPFKAGTSSSIEINIMSEANKKTNKQNRKQDNIRFTALTTFVTRSGSKRSSLNLEMSNEKN